MTAQQQSPAAALATAVRAYLAAAYELDGAEGRHLELSLADPVAPVEADAAERDLTRCERNVAQRRRELVVALAAFDTAIAAAAPIWAVE